ncbi:MAG: hypothetical protein JXR32_10820, partial [Anaerolineaceae bacterium]|nr:hypothetical protein [Anaerolineaceae bacterium]
PGNYDNEQTTRERQICISVQVSGRRALPENHFRRRSRQPGMPIASMGMTCSTFIRMEQDAMSWSGAGFLKICEYTPGDLWQPGYPGEKMVI